MDSQSLSNARRGSSRLPRLLKTFANVTFFPSPYSQSPISPFDWLNQSNVSRSANSSPASVKENAGALISATGAQIVENDKRLEVSVDADSEVLKGLHAPQTSPSAITRAPASEIAASLYTPTNPLDTCLAATEVASGNDSQESGANGDLEYAEAAGRDVEITDTDAWTDDREVRQSENQNRHIEDTSPSNANESTQANGSLAEAPTNGEGTTRDRVETPAAHLYLIDAANEPVEGNGLSPRKGSTTPEPVHTTFPVDDDKPGRNSVPDTFSPFRLVEFCPNRDQPTGNNTSDNLTTIDRNEGSVTKIQNRPNLFELASISVPTPELNSILTWPLEETQPGISTHIQNTQTSGDIASPSAFGSNDTAQFLGATNDTIKSPTSLDTNPFSHFPLFSLTAPPSSFSDESCSLPSDPLSGPTAGVQPPTLDTSFDKFLFSPPTLDAKDLNALDTSRFVFVEDSRYYTESPYSSYHPHCPHPSRERPDDLPLLQPSSNADAVIAFFDHIDHLVPSQPTMITFSRHIPVNVIENNNLNDGGDAAGILSAQSDVNVDFYDCLDEKHGERFLKLASPEPKGGSAAHPTITLHSQVPKALRTQRTTLDPDTSKVLHHAADSRTDFGNACGGQEAFEDGDGERAVFAPCARPADANFYPQNMNINCDIGGSTTEIRPGVSPIAAKEGASTGLLELRHNQNNMSEAQRQDLLGDCIQVASDWPRLGRRRRSHDHAGYEAGSSDMMPRSRISADSSSMWSESVFEAISAVSS